MLVSAKDMLDKARREKYAVGQFNINNLEWTKAILLTTQESNSPVILGVSEGAGKYMCGYKTIVGMVNGMLEELNITVPVALHLDHGSYEGCYKAMEAGFSSVMFDGSHYPIEENVAKTKEIVAYAHERNVTVEAEIGHVGEGDSYHVEGNTMLTTPEEAKKFVEQTGVDSLAVSIGTAHGEYKGIPHLNFERLQEIATEVSIPLVLHGGSGSGDENLSKAVELGIAKVNICTDLLNAARDNTKDGYAERSYYDSVTLAKDGFKDCLKHYYEVFHTK